MAERTSIVLADERASVRRALRTLLEGEGDLDVVAESGDADGAIRHVLECKPDVLVLDLTMLGRPSLEAIPKLREASPRTGIVVLTTPAEIAFAHQAQHLGALGYVLKESAGEDLVPAVRGAARGDVLREPGSHPCLAAEPEASAAELSERETDVLRLIALGHTNTEIAAKLYISVRTVETHRAHLLRKLGVSGRAELVRSALSRGLIET